MNEGLKRCQECKKLVPRERFNKWRGKPTGKCKSCFNRISSRNRRIRKSQWWKFMVEYNQSRCYCCGKVAIMTPDHIIATTRGGSDLPQNIQPLCNVCNYKKGTQNTDYRPTGLIKELKRYENN